MDPMWTSAASGLRARMQSLDMLANNLANTETLGYKADRELYSLYASAEASESPSGPDRLPVIEGRWTDFSQGVLRNTSNQTDFALGGRGFFAVNGPSGPLYTRNGSFRVSASGMLTTADGYPIRTVAGGTLTIDAAQPFESDAMGNVVQNGQLLGQMEVVDFTDASVLSKVGKTYFRNADPAAAPSAAAQPGVEQGKLEGSNVGAPEGAVRLVGIMRQFEMLQKAISLGSDMNRKAIDEVAKVTS